MKRTGADAPKTWQDLARVTGLCEKSVKAAITQGHLPGYRVGKLYVVPNEAFQRFVRGEWQPMPRPLFTEPIQPLPSFVRRRKTDAA